jgi:SAM-dependent methyltransferase
MVNVERQGAAAAVRDETALDIFRHQWELYRKFLKHDYLENAGAYAELRRFLTANVTRPFAFVDLACGDASGIVTALEGTAIAHYRGIDLAPPALELARHNLEALPCAVELDEADFVQAMSAGSNPADIVWISLSLHHLTTPDKRALMRQIHGRLSPNGALLIYEPTCRDGEDRATYLDRFEDTGRRNWTALSPAEFQEAMRHVRTCDLPETVSEWRTLGREAGFSRIAEVFKAPSDLFRMFSYRA